MNRNRTVRLLAIPIIAMMMLCGAFLIQDASDDSDADDSMPTTLSGWETLKAANTHNITISDTISIAPGYQWTQEMLFPSDLSDSVVSQQDKSGNVTVTVSNHNVTITIGSSANGSEYAVIKATHAASQQTAYLVLKFDVNSVRTYDYTWSGTYHGATVSNLNQILYGASLTFNMVSQYGVGTVEWTTSSSMSGNMALNNGVISGEPAVGLGQTIVVTGTEKLNGTATGNTGNVTITFSVYDNINNSSTKLNLVTYGASSDQSGAIPQTGSTLNVVWAVTKINGNAATANDLPSGFTFNTANGVLTITGSSLTKFESGTLTIKGTDTPVQGATAGGIGCSGQTIEQTIVYKAEPVVTFNGTTASSILTYSGHAASNVTVKTNTVGVTFSDWSVTGASDMTGIAIANGVLSVDATAKVQSGTTLTVTAKTACQQTVTTTISLTVSGLTSLTVGTLAHNPVVGTGLTHTMTVSGGHNLTYTVSATKTKDADGTCNTALTVNAGGNIATDNGTGLTITVTSDGKLVINASKYAEATITITAHSDDGQTDVVKTLDVVVNSVLGWDNAPTSGSIVEASS